MERAGLRFSRRFIGPQRPDGSQKFRRQADVLGRRQLVPFHRLEPCCLRPHHRLQFLQSGLHHRGMILTARNRDRQLVQHRQPAHAQPRVVQHHQQDTRGEQHFRQQVRFTWNVTGESRPVQVQRHQAGAEKERPQPNTPEAVPQQFDGCRSRHQPAGYLHPQPEGFRIRKIERAHYGADHEHPRDRHQHGQCSFRVRRDQSRRGKQSHRQHKAGRRECRNTRKKSRLTATTIRAEVSRAVNHGTANMPTEFPNIPAGSIDRRKKDRRTNA